MQDHPKSRAMATSVAVIAAVGAYFASPLLQFAHAGAAAFAGFSLGVGAGTTWYWTVTDGPDRKVVVSLIITGIGVLATFATLGHAFVLYAENDKRCWQIQEDMLSSAPRRSDGPDLFQALGCKPRGFAPVIFPKPAPPKPVQSKPVEEKLPEKNSTKSSEEKDRGGVKVEQVKS